MNVFTDGWFPSQIVSTPFIPSPFKQILCAVPSSPDTWCCFSPCVLRSALFFFTSSMFSHTFCTPLWQSSFLNIPVPLCLDSLTCLDRHWAALSLTRQSGTLIQTHTTVHLHRGHALTLSHWEAGIINSLGLSGVSTRLFSPDIIIARVETVTTRGHPEGGKTGVSYPWLLNNICNCPGLEGAFCCFSP